MPERNLSDPRERIRRHYAMNPIAEEGGWFAQSYRDPRTVVGADHDAGAVWPYSEPKPAGTAIICLLTGEPEGFSAMHRLLSDEVFYYHAGDPLQMLLLYPDGTSERRLLGAGFMEQADSGEDVQVLVPAGVWQGSRPLPGGRGWTLVGTSMAPGFTPGDFELGRAAELCAAYPAERELIEALTRV